MGNRADVILAGRFLVEMLKKGVVGVEKSNKLACLYSLFLSNSFRSAVVVTSMCTFSSSPHTNMLLVKMTCVHA